jgi:hypothetical protein
VRSACRHDGDASEASAPLQRALLPPQTIVDAVPDAYRIGAVVLDDPRTGFDAIEKPPPRSA